MHKHWVTKGYDQSVTYLADDLQNVVTHSSTLGTLGILAQTNNSIHKHSSIEYHPRTFIDHKRKRYENAVDVVIRLHDAIDPSTECTTCNIPNFQFGMLYNRSSLHTIFYCFLVDPRNFTQLKDPRRE